MGNQHGSIFAHDAGAPAVDIASKERSESLSYISHEVKTRLNAIIGFTEILKDSVTEPTQLHYLDIIRNSGESLLSIVRDNLEMPNGEAHPADDAAVQDCPVIGDASLDEVRKEWRELCAGGKTDSVKNCIFAVDDNENNLGLIVHFFAREHIKVFPFSCGDEVLDALRLVTPELILLDIIMPGMDGYEVCRRLKENEAMSTIPVIFLTSKADTDDVVRGFQTGSVDYISKPFRREELISRVRTHLKLHLTEQSLKVALAEKEMLLNGTLKGCIKVFVDILAMTNAGAFAQSLRVRNIAKRMSARLGLPNAWEIEIGVLLSQIGCAMLPPEIVMKKQSGERLTTQENAVFNAHPKAAGRVIANIPGLERVASSIQNQFTDYSQHGEQDIIRDFIRVVFDYDNLIQSGGTQQQALDEMTRKADRYNPLVLGALEAEVRKLMAGYVVRTVVFEELRAGMVLADDIRNMNNIILVRRNSELSQVLLEKLQNLRYCGRSYEPVKILEQVC